KPDAVLLTVEPNFVMYKHNGVVYGLDYVGIARNDDFSLNLPAVLQAVEKHRPALVFLVYPNKTFGVSFRREEVMAD
ncbi:histidinol-phosphate aminotransferase, partial [Neisseria arctica]